jgi:replicative DNA helicase
MKQRELYSQEAEQSVLGAIMLDGALIDDIACLLEPEDFYLINHQRIFSAMNSMAGQPIDAITISEEVDRTCNPGDEKSLDYIVQMIQGTPSTANVKAYARIVKERKTERDLFACGQEMQTLCMDNELSHQERLERSQVAFTALSSEKQASTQVSIKDSLRVVLDSVQNRFEGLEEGKQIKTGLSALDERIQGYRGGNLIIVAGRPGMAKTSVLMQMMKHAARHHGKAQVFSLEMPHKELTQRLVASCGKAHLGIIRNPKGAPQEFWSAFSAGTQVVNSLPIVIDDQGGLSIHELRSRARVEHRKGDLSIIGVDYLQLMKAKGKDNRHQEIGEITRGLKEMAKELDIPVIALSQLNRGVEGRPDKRPFLSDLRESGSIEEDADIIHLLYRDEYYDENTPLRGVLEIDTAKFRDGETGIDRVSFEGKYNLITDLDAAKYAQQQQEHESQGNKSGFQY